MRSDRGYLRDDFEKEKTATFDGEINKLQNAEEWFLGMNKFFMLHDYSKNFKARVATFSLKGKENIRW